MDFNHWIRNGEKFALIGIDANAEGEFETAPSASGVRMLTNMHVEMPSHWQGWLGSQRAEEIARCDVMIVASSDGSPAAVLDGENQRLFRSVWHAYVGLLLMCQLAPSHAPVHLTGARIGEEVDVRQQSNLDTPVHGFVTRYPAVTAPIAEGALRLGTAINSLADPLHTGWSWRLVRVLTNFVSACVLTDLMDRIHQFARCIEGLILPPPGGSEKKFKSRTELFIGPHHHDLMGEIYQVRSAVEHLNEDRYLHPYDRQRMIGLIEKEAIIANLAREVLRRILGSAPLIASFSNRGSCNAFWALSHEEQRAAWGVPIDPMLILRDFEPEYLSDTLLGGA